MRARNLQPLARSSISAWLRPFPSPMARRCEPCDWKFLRFKLAAFTPSATFTARWTRSYSHHCAAQKLGDNMKQERFHASDYTPSEVEAAKRVMIEVAQNLGEYADACVLVGGWVPELLLPEAQPKHTGSIDVDLALSPERLSADRYASLLDALKRKGYQAGEKPFQLFKELKVGREMVRVDVEFLAPKGTKMKKSRPKHVKRVPGFRVLETEGCALAFDDP